MADTEVVNFLSRIRIPYVVLLALAAFAVSGIGAYFSISGLAKLFSGASVAVMCMAAALEFSKVVAAGFLHQNWDRLGLLLRIYLSVAVVILVAITSMGIYGYLSHAYQRVALELNNVTIQENSLNKEESEIKQELARLQATISAIPENRISKRLEVQKELEPQIQKLKSRSFELNVELQKVLIQKQGFQTEIGPMIYVAQAFGRSQDSVAQWFILMFVSVFDPLAVCLVFAVSWSIKNSREEEMKVFANAAAKSAEQNPKLVA